MAQQMIGIYEEFASQVAAMPVVVGRKSSIESFAGANRTYTIEAMMGDRKALQVGLQLCLVPGLLCFWSRCSRHARVGRGGAQVGAVVMVA